MCLYSIYLKLNEKKKQKINLFPRQKQIFPTMSQTSGQYFELKLFDNQKKIITHQYIMIEYSRKWQTMKTSNS